MTEAYATLANTLRYYGKVTNNEVKQYGSQIPFNFELISHTNVMTKPSEFKSHIQEWINKMPKGGKLHANWVVSVSVVLYKLRSTNKYRLKNSFISKARQP